MKHWPLSMALLLSATISAAGAEWETGMARGLETYAATANGGAMLLVCDPDRVYNQSVSHAYFGIKMPTANPDRIVVLAASGVQAEFAVRDGIALQREAQAEAWSKLIDMVMAGGQLAVVSARDSFTLDLDPLPGFRCR